MTAACRQKRVPWARSQRHSTSVQWRKRVFTDEIHVEISPRGMFVKMFNAMIRTNLMRSTSASPPTSNSAYDERFIAPAFKSARTSVLFLGTVGYGYHSPLAPIRKRTLAERTPHDKDRLGLNSKQYCEEVLGPYLLLLLRQTSSIE